MPSILIVEDHPPARHLRARLLTDAGFHIEECDSAQAVLDRVLPSRAGVDLVLMDVGLPDGNGFEVCERIKTVHGTLPVVLISAVYRTARARRDGLERADAYLVEPTPPARLVETVRRLTLRSEQAASTAAVIRTTSEASILWMNEAAAALLNLAARAARGRSLLAFFDGERGRVQAEMERALAGQVCEFDAPLRPRERRPLTVPVDLTPAEDGTAGVLEWRIESPVVPARKRVVAAPTAATPVTQTLWHVGRPSSPFVTAILACAPSGGCELQVAFGNVARQHVTFTSAIAALERAERLLVRLESIGYCRVRRDQRRRPADG